MYLNFLIHALPIYWYAKICKADTIFMLLLMLVKVISKYAYLWLIKMYAYLCIVTCTILFGLFECTFFCHLWSMHFLFHRLSTRGDIIQSLLLLELTSLKKGSWLAVLLSWAGNGLIFYCQSCFKIWGERKSQELEFTEQKTMSQ